MPNSQENDSAAASPSRIAGARELLRVVGLRKSFPGVQAIADGSIQLHAGEILALVGENGAGKSTLIKTLTGVHQPDSGTILIDGRPHTPTSPVAAQSLGIVAIHQEFNLLPALSISDNLFLGRESSRLGLINQRAQTKAAECVLKRLGTDLDPDARVSTLSVSQQQLVEIARALLVEARILIMDEPTASLSPREVEHLFDILRELVCDGVGIIFVSHRLDEVLSISNTVTVMRDGTTVATRPTQSMTRHQLIELMVGRPLEDEFPQAKAEIGSAVLSVENLTGGVVREISFSVRSGEILGIAGLMGAGRTELARLIFGADRCDSGHVSLNGNRIDISNPRKTIGRGICLLTEDRKGQGLVLCASSVENYSLPNLRKWSRLGLLNLSEEKHAFQNQVDALSIKVTGPDQKAETLSGGNQQKLLVARWLETNSKVFIFDEPTRGIDVGAKYEMYLIIRRLAAEGKAVILISSELPEILGMCDRIIVMKQGRISGEIVDVSNANQRQIMSLAV